MAKGYWAYITPVDRPGRPGGPVDPDYGIDEGVDPGWGYPGRPPHVGNRPPGSYPGRPDQGLPHPGRPVDPGWGWGGSEHPGHGLPRPPMPPHLWPRPPGGGLPVDPDWGVGSERPDQLPIYPMDPAHPDNTLPPVDGEEPPPVDPPPGTVWPPLPPEFPGGKAFALVGITGVGYRYIVVTIPPPQPDQGLPPTSEPPVATPKRSLR